MTNQIIEPLRRVAGIRLNPKMLAWFFGVVVLGRGALLLYMAGPGWMSDSLCFVLFGRLLRDFSYVMPLYLRTPPYLILNAITFSDISPYPLLALHAALAAFSTGLLVYAVATRERLAGAVVGIALTCDIVGATSQRFILIEGPLASFQMIALALVVLHFGKRCVPLPMLFLSGAVYAWCMLFRQSNLLLLAPIALIYIYNLRSARRASVVVIGMLSMLFALSFVNYTRTNDWRLWAQGGWYAEFPMFNLGLFSEKHGPASRNIAEDLINCGITDDPSQLRFLVQGGVSQWDFEACLRKQELARLNAAGGSARRGDIAGHAAEPKRPVASENPYGTSADYYDDWYRKTKWAYDKQDWAFDDRVASLISTSYMREALPKNLDKVPGLVLREMSRFIAGQTYALSGNLWLVPIWSNPIPNYICPFDWCNQKTIPPASPFSGSLIGKVHEFTKWTTQLYIALSISILGESCTDMAVFSVFIALSILIVIVDTGVLRIVGILSILFILYTAALTALMNIYIPRYTSTLSAFYLLHSFIAVCSMLVLVKRLAAKSLRG